jgi:hypothetical protein
LHTQLTLKSFAKEKLFLSHYSYWNFTRAIAADKNYLTLARPVPVAKNASGDYALVAKFLIWSLNKYTGLI